MNTDTPETDAQHLQFAMGGFTLDFCRKLERERDEWKEKFIQQNKDLGCEMMDPNGTIWDHAKTLQRERDDAREQRDTLIEQQQQWRLSSVCRELTEQRDTLVKVIEAASVLIAAKGRHNTMLAYNGLRNALESLTPNQP